MNKNYLLDDKNNLTKLKKVCRIGSHKIDSEIIIESDYINS